MTSEYTDMNTCDNRETKQQKPEGLTKEFSEFIGSILGHFQYFSANNIQKVIEVDNIYY